MSFRSRIGCRPIGALVAALIVGIGWAPAAELAVNEENVDRAVARAVEFIKQQRNDDGHWERWAQGESGHFNGFGGDSSLALLALLYAGENQYAEDMRTSLDWLGEQDLAETYTVGTRAHVFALIPEQRYRGPLRRDVEWLSRAMFPPSSNAPGAYTYRSYRVSGGGSNHAWDNSNSQYAVLGVWMADEAGVSVPRSYWQIIAKHWLSNQVADGGWGYQSGDAANSSRGSMTAAGLATLYVALDQLHSDRGRGGELLMAAIERGMDWMGTHFSSETNPGVNSGHWKYYYYYSVERIGRASGQKRFRDVDWFQQIAANLLANQQPDGSWEHTGDQGAFEMVPLRNTAFALMFLCHGRAPVLFNKLEWVPPELRAEPPTPLTPAQQEEMSRAEIREHEDKLERYRDWNVKPRDVAGLTRYAQRSLERLLNWQIVRLDESIDDLLEAPVLYLTGTRPWELTDEERQKLRDYALRGGMIFAVADRNSGKFTRWIRELAGELFADYPLRELPADHPLLSGEVRAQIEEPPPLFEVHNGQRTLLLLCPSDISDMWQRASQAQQTPQLQLGANVYLYATDKARVRSRLSRTTLSAKAVPITQTIHVARIKHDGIWNPEPYGWERLTRYMLNETGAELRTQALRLTDPMLKDFKIAHLTGTGTLELSADELAALRRFVTGGGVLITDATGGDPAFFESVTKVIQETMHVEAERLPANSPLQTAEGLTHGVSLKGVTYRRAARRESMGSDTPRLMVTRLGRQVVAINSPLDLSIGLLGTHVYDCRGYDGDSALRIMRNMLLYANLSALEKARLAR